MDLRLTYPFSEPMTLLFSSLSLNFDEKAFKQLRKIIIECDENKWISDLIRDLPKVWATITTALPKLQDKQKLEQLEHVHIAVQDGTQPKTQFPLPNTVLIPLVIISHLTQYTSLLRRSNVDISQISKSDVETIGLCTGLLSSFAVASAADQEQFTKYGAVAVRLGMLIGMVIDAQDAASESGPSKSISAVWTSSETHDETLRILKDFPDVRIPIEFLLEGNSFTGDSLTHLNFRRILLSFTTKTGLQ